MVLNANISKENDIKEEGREKKMCIKLNQLKGKEPEQVYSLANTSLNEIPVDLTKMLSALKITTIESDFEDLEKGALAEQVKEKGAILGAVVVLGDNIAILYRSGESDNRTRFTIAHELAHCCSHTDKLINGHIQFRHENSFSEKEEFDANVFAGKLLIPSSPLSEIYDSMIVPLSDVLAKRFAVSVKVMEARLDYLKKPYYKFVKPQTDNATQPIEFEC